jgi:hypothetical protein
MSTTKPDSLHEHIPTIMKSSGAIRQRVEDRHWQLFEARLKKQLPEVNKENYTNTNDYRIIDRLKKVDHPQTPVKPSRRWETFCHHVTNKPNETERVKSIFHNVWQKNWNTKQADKTQKRSMTDPTLNEDTFLNCISTNDNDRKKISTILHRTDSTENVSSNKK